MSRNARGLKIHSEKQKPAPESSKIAFFILLGAQFLSAFADNAILFTTIAIVLHDAQLPAWYIPALQSVFLVSFVLLAPWVGPVADRYSKPRVLIGANMLKAAGTGLFLIGIEPLLAYAVVGLGAALYSPAKYGILPELVPRDRLVRANSWMEGSTIVAILTGMLVGGKIADVSSQMALWLVLALFVLSALMMFGLPRLKPKSSQATNPWREFWGKFKIFIATPKARFALLGASLFWATAAVLRVILVVWAPEALGIDNAGEIAELTMFLALGIIAGAVLVPRLVPLENLSRVRLAGYAMSVLIASEAVLTELWTARLVLFAIGMSGGVFIVPINATLQHLGHQGIGSGGAVAIQNGTQSCAMLAAVGIYTLVAAAGVSARMTLAVLGGLVFVATLSVSLFLRRVQQ
ncbi:MAG TPA: lysophospholipid transporter LplT [Methylothermaceae bacterium]|nr:lysophospholipid transporter LplT [Methylothermaceae bacterium]